MIVPGMAMTHRGRGVMTIRAVMPLPIPIPAVGECGQAIDQQYAGEQSGNKFFHDDYLLKEKTPGQTSR